MTPTARVARRNARRRRLRAALLVGALTLGTATVPIAAEASGAERGGKEPTIVLVHGAWADASSWSRVVRRLQSDGYPVLAPANPLRSLASDSAYLDAILETIDGPIVLVGHSYGASVITHAATGDPDVRALVFVNGSVPAEGETVAELAGPKSALSVPDPTTIFDVVPAQLPPTPESDVYLKRSTFLKSFATGLGRAKAKTLWATQRPVTLGALNEPSGTPAWDTIPSWYLIGTKDLVIPATAQHEMAVKTGSTIARFKAGHLDLISDPGAVTRVITAAVRATR
ncbi:alpha/beta hydrolase [Nocardioides sp. YIM 152315]|uniref:alpha/beta fold hydrolase n=1 Tax=Nocardioides sp. YIM 152315 TaxID=3031760 RepID=UPI0023DB6D53|nr:alpha/beta hydrolase [Nocardioides sp. YIM 152315]MDF1605454.1 alpha/beta hydrolase [Nocardioides sp. YIM 152315]